jgi:predicted ATP-dependent endonuclease of OLD family
VNPGPDDYFFSLKRGDAIFSFEEMSSGEQAVFALLFEFVRQDIGNSVVLIDELELHLHPSEQQALLGALPELGRDCQFIVTTHSPYVAKAFPPECVVRLPGGLLCL